MARSVKYRRTCSDAVSWRQDQALNSTMYILKTYGPTGFLLKEEGESKEVKVYIGDPHSCTCSVFQKERDLCKHISWLLLKKYKISRDDPASWQLGLVEREIQEILHSSSAASASRAPRSRQTGGGAAATAARAAAAGGSAQTSTATTDEEARPALDQRDIGPDDVCPICQDGLLAKREPVTYCKYGCANSIHIKCMKVWAEHQVSQGETTISCPFCREDFGPLSHLKEQYRNAEVCPTQPQRPALHDGVSCRSCRMAPIAGKCYRCASCNDYYLCQACLNKPVHQEHTSFEYRQTANGRWKPAERNILGGSVLPAALVNQLMARPLTDQDYELLLQLDTSSGNSSGMITEQMLSSLPLEKVRAGSSLLAAGSQCRVCLRAYQIDQKVRRLPCRHKFHKECIDNWLLHQRGTCPVDGSAVLSYGEDTSPNTHSAAPISKPAGRGQAATQAAADLNTQASADGIAILTGILTINGATADGLSSSAGQVVGSSGVPASTTAESYLSGRVGLPPTGKVQRGTTKDAAARLLGRPTIARSAPAASSAALSATSAARAQAPTDAPSLTLADLLTTSANELRGTSVSDSRRPPGSLSEFTNGRAARPTVRQAGRSTQLRSRSRSTERRRPVADAGRTPSVERTRVAPEAVVDLSEPLVGQAVLREQEHSAEQHQSHQLPRRWSRTDVGSLSVAPVTVPSTEGTMTSGVNSFTISGSGVSSSRLEVVTTTSAADGPSGTVSLLTRGQLRKPPVRKTLQTRAPVGEGDGPSAALQLEGSSVRTTGTVVQPVTVTGFGTRSH